jgi:hypothetical protein
MAESTGRTVLVINGRVMEIPGHRRTGPIGIESKLPWWGAVTALGLLTVALGSLLGLREGTAAAIGGVALFLVTAVLAGVERYEAATALGVSALLWTSAGVAIYLGLGGPALLWFAAFGSGGAAMAVVGMVGALRVRSGTLRHRGAGA